MCRRVSCDCHCQPSVASLQSRLSWNGKSFVLNFAYSTVLLIPWLLASVRLQLREEARWTSCTYELRKSYRKTSQNFLQETVLIIRRVQPTRWNVSQFIYFCKTLYMFQTAFPSIIRSSKLHIQRQVFVFVRPILLPAASPARLAAGSSIGLTNTWRCMCSFELLMMDGKPVWNM